MGSEMCIRDSSFTIVETGIEAPASLTEMMDSEGAANLFGSMFN